jgi:hypothetical protein
MPCNFIKLVDVEEMNYLAAKGEGEVSESPLVIDYGHVSYNSWPL